MTTPLNDDERQELEILRAEVAIRREREASTVVIPAGAITPEALAEMESQPIVAFPALRSQEHPAATCRGCVFWRNFVGRCPVGTTMPNAPACGSFRAVSEPFETRRAHGFQWTREGWTTWWICDACGHHTQDPRDDDTAGKHSCPGPVASAELNLHETFDASVWAREFVRRFGGDEGLMLGWFANAIMAGYDHARRPIYCTVHGGRLEPGPLCPACREHVAPSAPSPARVEG